MTEHANITSALPQTKFDTSETLLANYYGIELPGISQESQKAVLKLLDQNDKNFDIFFNDKGFHNHCVHHLLAAYSCGASPDRLESIYQKFADYLKPRHPPKITITEENWTTHLGQNELWTDYLNFFQEVIKENGIRKTFETYGFHPKLFPRLFSGAFHPIIHVGYGIEFQIPLILAEGLAEAAVHQNRYENILNDQFWQSKGIENKKIMDIITDIQNDKNFDGVITHNDDMKFKIVLNERSDAIREYASQWAIPETEEGVKNAAKELYESVALAYGGTAIRPDKKTVRLDFFLMHGLTSVFFVYIALPHLNLEKKVKILRAHFASVLTYYVARGRPRLFLDTLKNYFPQKLKAEPNPWFDVIRHGLLEENEPHVIKVVRSLLKANQEWGPENGNIFLKIAQLTVEGYAKFGWSMNGLGFDEEWKEESIFEKVKGQVTGLFEKKEK